MKSWPQSPEPRVLGPDMVVSINRGSCERPCKEGPTLFGAMLGPLIFGNSHTDSPSGAGLNDNLAVIATTMQVPSSR